MFNWTQKIQQKDHFSDKKANSECQKQLETYSDNYGNKAHPYVAYQSAVKTAVTSTRDLGQNARKSQ